MNAPTPAAALTSSAGFQPALPSPKYRHPHNGMSWSGRGKKPRWVDIWLEAGNSLEALTATPAAVAQSAPDVLDAQYVHPHDLAPSPTNPRKTFPADKIAEMAESIRRHGILQPILVRPLPGEPGRYEIIAGERRWRAAQLAERALVPVLIRHLSDQETVEFQVIENLHREDLHPLEEAEGYELLMQRHAYSAEELAAKIGKSKAYVYARLKLTALCDAARVAFREGKLSASTALLVARIPGAALQAQYLESIVNAWNGPMSTRDAARVAQNHYMLRLAEAGFDTTLAGLLAGATPCTTCPKRSGNQPELFADVASADVCTDPDCFAAKREAWVARQRADAEAAGRAVLTGKQAEDIVPSWANTPTTRSESGYLALDAPCLQARHLAIPIEDAAPIEPEEPADDTDEAAVAAYRTAYDTWVEDMEAFEAREEAALPTYRALLAGAGAVVPTVLVQHPKTGILVECVTAKDAAPILQAQGLAAPVAYTPGGNSDKEREKVAREQTAYRSRLLTAILFGAGEDALDVAELRGLAAVAFNHHDFETQKLAVKLWTSSADKIDREATTKLFDEIALMEAGDLYGFLRLVMLVGHIRVASYASDPTTTPAALLFMADRWGIDPEVVRRQAADDTTKKGRK